MLEAREAGAEISFTFRGKAVGIYCLAGPEAGIIEYSIGGAPFKKRDLYTVWSGGLYLPWFVIFDDELFDNKHSIIIKISDEKNPKSAGNSCQIIAFCVSENS